MNKENSDTYSVTCRCPRILIFVLAAALVFGAVCVGGVSGAVFEVSTEQGLRDAVEKANINGEDDTIIITGSFTRSTNTPIDVRGEKLTIRNKEGVDVTITLGSAGFLGSSRSLFRVYGSDLVLSTAASGNLTIMGSGQIIAEPGGGAVYVDNDGSIVMDEGVTITNFGLWGGATESVTDVSYNGAGIYVSNGSFTMNGGRITDCNAKLGGAIYISPTGTCTINDGLITENGHVYKLWNVIILHQSKGGAVFVESGGHLIQNGGTVSGNYGNPADISYTGATDVAPETPETPKIIQYTANHYTQDTDDLTVYTLSDTSSIFGSVGDNPMNVSKTYLGYEAVSCNPAVISADTTSVDIYYDLNVSYFIEIPPMLNISGKRNYGTMDIIASYLFLPENGYVSVIVSSKNNFDLQYVHSPSVAVSYILMVEGNTGLITRDNPHVTDFTMVDYLQSETEKPMITLNATVTGHPPFTGDYTDILTFTMEPLYT